MSLWAFLEKTIFSILLRRVIPGGRISSVWLLDVKAFLTISMIMSAELVGEEKMVGLQEWRGLSLLRRDRRVCLSSL